ncbi:hypothetical protein GWI33_009460 [Rhynchophorus ferrugineus]|uniref:Uncharacterized protein n=1 Tax=Rhynchophorus ferrugineus TaxID=354439 RepID=A0A834IDM5_RHYFE|nr:hypothetical protein GWI33_009460 [Rhynchophorus ferrugineus]
MRFFQKPTNLRISYVHIIRTNIFGNFACYWPTSPQNTGNLLVTANFLIKRAIGRKVVLAAASSETKPTDQEKIRDLSIVQTTKPSISPWSKRHASSSSRGTRRRRGNNPPESTGIVSPPKKLYPLSRSLFLPFVPGPNFTPSSAPTG